MMHITTYPYMIALDRSIESVYDERYGHIDSASSACRPILLRAEK
jgi:hypothetical protein